MRSPPARFIAYNPLDQLTSSATDNQTTTYTYDGRGNLTGTSSGNGAHATTASYTYDAADRQTGATLSSGFSASYAYDADGRRVKQTVGSSVTNSLWDEASAYGDVVTESDGSGAIQASYVLGGGELLAQVRGSGASGVASYMLPDGQGSVRALANSAGSITDTYRYDAYGNQTSSTGTTTNPYRYDGQRLDDGTGLYQLRARSYDPGTGRFLSRDTAEISLSDPAQLNRYGYAGDNPITFGDPSGHDFAQYLISIGVRVPVGVPPAVTAGVAVGAILILLGLLRFAVALPRAVPVDVPVSTPASQREVMLDTNAVYGYGASLALKLPDETFVIDETVAYELARDQGKPGIPPIPPDVVTMTVVPDKYDPTVARFLRKAIENRTGKSVQNDPGRQGDVIIGTTALVTGRPIITFDKVFGAALRSLGGQVRP